MLYWTWLVLAATTAFINFLGFGRLLSDYENVDYTDMVTFIAASVMSFVTAAASGSVDVIVSCTTQNTANCVLPYGGELWALGAFLGMGILDIGMTFVSLLLLFRLIRKRRGY